MSDAAALDAIDSDYQEHMARRPRATRSLERLDDIVRRAGALTGGDLGDRARDMLARYTNERTLVSELQAGGALSRRAHRANAIANMLQHRYSRHFASKDRATRDVELLREMAGRLDWCVKEMEAVATQWDHHIFEAARKRHIEQSATLAQELVLIPQEVGRQSTGDQARSQAQRANHQFRWYRLCFAGKARTTRRLALLDRMTAGLTGVLTSMDALIQQGLRDDVHDANRKLVADNLGTWQKEHVAIRQAQAAQTGEQMHQALGASANGMFTRYREGYAGKDRSKLDAEPLAELCDELAETALQMDENDRVWGGYESNLFVVLENLMVFEDEIIRIRTAKGG